MYVSPVHFSSLSNSAPSLSGFTFLLLHWKLGREISERPNVYTCIPRPVLLPGVQVWVFKEFYLVPALDYLSYSPVAVACLFMLLKQLKHGYPLGSFYLSSADYFSRVPLLLSFSISFFFFFNKPGRHWGQIPNPDLVSTFFSSRGLWWLEEWNYHLLPLPFRQEMARAPYPQWLAP